MLKLTSVSGLGMFASNEDEVRLKAIQTILSARKESHSHSSTKVRQFVVPEINIEANNFYDMIDFSDEVYEPPLLTRFKNNEIGELDSRPLKLLHPCHNQAVERHVKLVTEVARKVATFSRRDGLIRQRNRSRKIMKRFDCKNQFNV